MSTAEVISLLVALIALTISAANYWNSAGKPAEIVLDYLPTDDEVAGGGTNDRPGFSRITLTVAVANEGARAGLLTSIGIEAVKAHGSPEFASGGVTAPPHVGGTDPQIIEVEGAGQAAFPRTLEGGDVRSLLIRFQMQGPFLDLVHTQYAEEPNQMPYAEMLKDLESVDFVVGWEYQTQGGLFRRTARRTATGRLTVSIPGEVFVDRAASLWRDANKNALVKTLGLDP